MHHRRQKSNTDGGGSSKPTWLEQKVALKNIKLTLFDSRKLSPHKLDRESIFCLNNSGLDDETFFTLVKRAAAEWLLAKDYQCSDGNNAHLNTPRGRTTKKASKQARKFKSSEKFICVDVCRTWWFFISVLGKSVSAAVAGS